MRLYKDQIQRSPVLSHGTGPNQGSPRFPLGRCVFFTHISRQQADAKGLLEALPANACLFSDDLDFDTESSEGKRTFVSKLKQSFNLRFSFPPLAAAELTLLRALIFPEVRIASSPHRLRNERDAALVQALDLQQERTAKSIPEGHRILKGVPAVARLSSSPAALATSSSFTLSGASWSSAFPSRSRNTSVT